MQSQSMTLHDWSKPDPSIQRQARFVSAVAAKSRQTDNMRVKQAVGEMAYLEELSKRLPKATAPPPLGSLWPLGAI